MGWAVPTGVKMVQSEVASRLHKHTTSSSASSIMCRDEGCRRGLWPQLKALLVKLGGLTSRQSALAPQRAQFCDKDN